MPTPLDFARQEVEKIGRDGKKGVREPEAYDLYTGGRNEAWCAHFVSWLYAQAGFPLPGWFPPTPSRMPPTAGCNYLMKRMREFGRILSPGERPQPNDLIFYKKKAGAAEHGTGGGSVFEQPGYYGFPVVYGHVGIVEGIKVDPKTGKEFVVTIEGNYSNKVARVETRIDHPSIGAYARPAGATASEDSGITTLLASAVAVYAVWRYKNR